MTEHYEILYILPASLTPEETAPFAAKVAALIKENEGEITKADNLGKQKFAYPLKGQSHGYYFVYEFDLPKAKLLNLNRLLMLSKDLVRFLVIKKHVKTQEEITDEKNRQARLAKRKEQEIEKLKTAKEDSKEKPAKEKAKEKISMEELDKKLDEILSDDKIL